MKKIFLSLLFIVSAFVSFGQAGSQSLSGVFFRVQDTVTYQSQAATKHSNGYRDIYFNEQATTKHWDIWNGSSYDHVFDFNAGGGSGSDPVFALTPNIQTTSFTLSPADTATMIILDNVADLVISLDDFSSVDRGMQFVFYRKTGTDTVYFDVNGESMEFTTLGISEKGYSYLYYNFTDNEFYLAGSQSVEGGAGSGTVNNGNQYRIAYYATTGTAVSEASAITASRALKSDANGVPTHFDTSTEPSLTELTYVKGVSSAIQTQLNGKQSTITFGTGVQTALGNNIGSAGAPVLFDGALGTPSSGTLTNATGLPPTTGISGWPANSSGVLTNNGSGTLSWASAGGTGTVTDVTGTSPIVITGTSTVTPNVTINNAAADGSTKGAASFTANDFNASSGNISIDYTNGQTAASGTKGFLTGTDWDTFNGKQATGLSWLLASGGTLSGANTITGTTTNTLKAVFASLGTTQTDGAGLWLSNTTAAAAGAQQRSPMLTFEGQGWKTNATAASQSVKWGIDALPVQAAANPSVNLTFSNSINGAAYSQVATLSSGGVFTAGQFTTNSGNVTWLGGQTITTGGGTMSVNTLGGTNTTLLSIIPQASITGTSGTQVAVNIGSSTGFGPTSGTAEYSLLRLNSAVNQTGGANGDIRVLDINTTYTAAGGNVIGIHYRPTVTSISGTHTALKLGSGSVSVDNGNLTLATAGNKLLIKEGSNAALGQATLVGGTVTVNNTIVTANSKIFLTVETPGGTQGFLSYTKSASTSFTINSTSGTETSTVNWVIIEPAP